MGAHPNSIRAYGAHVLSGKAAAQNERVLALLLSAARPMSRKQIAAYFRYPAQDGGPEIPLASVCRCVDALLPRRNPVTGEREGPGLIVVDHTAPDPSTGHRVDYVAPAPAELASQIRMSFTFLAPMEVPA